MSNDVPARRRRRPPERTGEGGRRLRSAASAILVSLGALIVGLFLNAPGVYKSAHIQQAGWKRDLALGFTRPLDTVSHALLLDRPREVLKAALGRSHDDEINTSIVVPERPPQASGGSSRATKPTKRAAFSPTHKLSLWIAGDSLVVVPGESLLRAVGTHSAIGPAGPVDGQIATGLERPDIFNWFTTIRDAMRARKPRAVVVMFGGNDDHSFMTGLRPGTTIGSFGSPSWTAEYRRRVGAIMDTVTENGAYLVWIGLPITRDPGQTQRFDTLNAIFQSEAARRAGRVSYLDTYFSFAGDDGGYAQYLQESSGRLVRMRADDGVHFERPAGDLIARAVLHQLNQHFDLTSWRKRASQSTG
jgi:hypothetical protein